VQGAQSGRPDEGYKERFRAAAVVPASARREHYLVDCLCGGAGDQLDEFGLELGQKESAVTTSVAEPEFRYSCFFRWLLKFDPNHRRDVKTFLL
jgi:hypothetical protein